MKDEILKTILGIVRGSVLLVIGGVVFYNVYPKYSIVMTKTNADYRFNEVSGELEIRNDKNEWQPLVK
jgi:hypothetical protein